MDFQKLLLDVGKALSGCEVKALAFLCNDLLNQDLTSLESASDLFNQLIDHDLLPSEEPQLLTELLLTIQRPRLLRDYGLADKACLTKNLISPYRKLLYTLSEEITKNELRQIKFMLNNELPRRKLVENVTALEVFQELERMDLINDANLNKLETIFISVCPVLNEKIKQFTAQQAQEKSRPRSSSDPFHLNQVSKALPETGVQGKVRHNNIFASKDFQNFGRHEVRSHEPSGSVRKERIDVMERVPAQESTTSSVTQIKTQGLEEYPMTATKRGVCVIVNNYRFTEPKLGDRDGTMADQKSLQEVFTWLGFEVELYNECDRMKILSVLHELSRRDHSQIDCLVCCVLSHGQEGGVCGVDGLIVKLEELMDPFDGLKCPSLVEKPKLFFIQACQGTNTQKPVETDGPELSNICCDAKPFIKSIPSYADFLLGMATVPLYVSFRERSKGTWYIQSLCENLVQLVPSGCDLVSILTKVNADVSRKTNLTGDKKQMPQPAFTLRKRVIFPIPKTPAPSLH